VLGLLALAIFAALILLRLAWSWLSLRVTLYRPFRRDRSRKKPPFRVLVAAALAGVRGAITLAAVLSIPLTLPDGTPFPARELAIFLSAGVILISLVAAAIGLPLLLRGLPQLAEPRAAEQERTALIATADAAIRRVEAEQHAIADGRDDADAYLQVALRVMTFYRQRIEAANGPEESRAQANRLHRAESRLRRAALRAEREELAKLSQREAIPDASAVRLLRALDLAEAALVVEDQGG
jgi:CPA1 family monovalent cation:H+ antiporter